MRKLFQKNTKLVIQIELFALLICFCTLFHITPRALYCGEKVHALTVVKVNNKEVGYFKSKKEAEKVVKNTIQSKVPKKNFEKIEVKDKIEIEEKQVDSKLKVTSKKDEIKKIEKSIDVQTEYTEKSTTNDDIQVEEQKTDELYVGETKEVEVGEVGTKEVETKTIYINGEVKDTKTSEEVTKPAKKKIILIGTKERPKNYSTLGSKYNAPMYKGDGQSIVDYGKQFLGNPYVYGGTSLTKGCDCSGFIYRLYLDSGYSVPRVGFDKIGKKVSLAEARPGDIVTYKGHYALYIGNNKVIHASNPKSGIIETNINYSGAVLSINRVIE